MPMQPSAAKTKPGVAPDKARLKDFIPTRKFDRLDLAVLRPFARSLYPRKNTNALTKIPSVATPLKLKERSPLFDSKLDA